MEYVSPDLKKFLREILRMPPPTAANIARGNEWRKAGDYERNHRDDCICGGWYLIRKDENASISVHFAGCPRIAAIRHPGVRLVCRRCGGPLKEGTHPAMKLMDGRENCTIHCPQCVISFSHDDYHWRPED